MYITSEDRIAEYRERAQLACEAAEWMSLHDAQSQLLETAAFWELLADEAERREARPKPLVHGQHPAAIQSSKAL